MVDIKLESQKSTAGGSGVRRVDAVGRRWYTDQFKASVVEQCARSGVSVAKVALGHGLNANLVRKWINAGRVERRIDDASRLPVTLIPVSVSDSPQQPGRGDCVVMPALELRVGKLAVSLSSGATAEQLRAIVQALQ